MIKFAFVQNIWFEYPGTMYLSAALKKAGHSCEVFIGRDNEIIKKMVTFNPDIVAFSIFAGQVRWAINLAKKIKDNFGFKKFVIMGGAYPTYFPNVIKNEYVDAICIGEGEEAIVELANAFQKGEDFKGIRNFWFKTKNEIIKNPLRPLIQDLDSIPFADRDIYYKYNYFMEYPNKHFIVARGCPYGCSFCFNNTLKEMYSNISKKYVRCRSPENVIKEIKEVKARYPLPSLRFLDGTFILNKQMSLEFLTLYKKEVHIPFFCNIRANAVDEQIISALKEANCYRVSFGIESGNETIRNTILNKGVTDDQIKNTAMLLKKYNIDFNTTNMFGLPDESLSDAWKTIQMNIDLKVKSPWTSIFQPYPGLKISSYILEKKLMDRIDIVEETTADAHSSSPLKLPHVKRIENLHKFVYLIARFPFIKPLVKLLIRLPPNAIFTLAYRASYLLFFYSEQKRLSPLRTLKEAIKLKSV